MQAPPWELKAVQKIDDLLESFLGIRDPDLGMLTVLYHVTCTLMFLFQVACLYPVVTSLALCLWSDLL